MNEPKLAFNLPQPLDHVDGTYDFRSSASGARIGRRAPRVRRRAPGKGRGSINDVRCITEPSDVIPSAALISVYEETATGGVGVCEDPENKVNRPVVVPSDELESSSKVLSRKDVGVCEMSEIDIPTGDLGVFLSLRD